MRYLIFLLPALLLTGSYNIKAQNLSFSGGRSHTVVLCDNDQIALTGSNESGQLGQGTASAGSSVNSFIYARGENGTGLLDDIKQIDAGSGSFTLALTCDGEVYAWGNNRNSQINLPAFVPQNVNSPVKVPGINGVGTLQDIRFVSGGSSVAYVITETDRIVAWGGNQKGQTGRGTSGGNEVNPGFVLTAPGTPLENVKFVDGGDDFGVALLNDGTVWFWGENARGSGGIGGPVFDDGDAGAITPFAVQVRNSTGTGFLTGIEKITAGDRHVLALATDGTLWAWGANNQGQIGDGTGGGAAHKTLPVRVNNIVGSPGNLTGVRNMAAGNGYSMALLDDGTVVTWGDRDALGRGGADNREPVRVQGVGGTGILMNITSISDGDEFALALDASGQLYSWGVNDDGELGTGTPANQDFPTIITSNLPTGCAVSPPNEPPLVNLGPDQDLCTPNTLLLDANDNEAGLTFEWFNRGATIAGATSRTYTALDSGYYKVIATKEITACGVTETFTDADSVLLTCPPCPDPGAITLKGQGISELDSLKVCGSQVLEVLIDGTIRNSGFEYQFFYDNGTGFVSQGPFSSTRNFTALSTGNYSVSVRVTGEPCFKTDTIHFRRDLVPTISNAGANQTICENSINLSANDPMFGTGEWSLKTGTTANIDDALDRETEVSGLQNGDNTFIWTISNGVCTPSASEVTITKQIIPAKPDLGGPTTVCGDEISLTAPVIVPATATGEWKLVSGNAVFTPNARTTNITGLNSGVNEVRWVVTNGVCADSTTKRITSITPPTVADAGPNDTVSICDPTYTLTGNTPISGTGAWTRPVGGGSITNPTNPTSDLTAIPDGTERLVWTISQAGCPSSTDTLTILKSSIAVASVSIDSDILFPVCGTTPVTFTATPVNGGVSSFRWFKNGTLVGTDSDTYLENTPTTGDSVYVELTSDLGCVTDKIVISDSIGITIDENPSMADAGTGGPICSGSFVLNATAPTVGLGRWDNGFTSATFVNASAPNTTVNDLSTGINELLWITSNGVCPNDTGRVSITVSGDLTRAEITLDYDSICEGNTYNISGNSAKATETTRWFSSGDGAFSSNNTNSTYTPGAGDLSANSAMLYWEIANGVCDPSLDSLELRIDAVPSTAISGMGGAICAESFRLNATAPTVGTGRWDNGVTSATFVNALAPNTTVNDLSTGINELLWITSNGVCPNDTGRVSITVSGDLTTAEILLDNDSICEGNTYNISGNSAKATETTRWFSSGDGAFSSNNPNSTYTPGAVDLSANSVMLYWEIANGICDPSVDSLELRIDNAITADAGEDVALCNTITSLILDANIPAFGIGTWVDVSGTVTIDDRNNPKANLSSISSDLSLRWEVKNGACEATDIFNLSSVSSLNPKVEIDYSKTVICIGENITFTALPTHGGTSPTYIWSINGVPQPEVSSVISRNDLNNNDRVTLTMISNNSCVVDTEANSTDITPISVSSPPISNITSGDVSICETNVALLTAVASNSGFNYKWLKDGILQEEGTDLVEVIISDVDQSGEWTLVVNNDICPEVTSLPVTVIVDENPIVSISQNILSDEIVELTGVTSIGMLSWSPSINLSSATNPETIFTASNSPLNNIITLTSVNGNCTNSTNTNVLIIPKISAPNVFTPNGDGDNELFYIKGMDARPEAEVSIFNRWGKEVYSTNNYASNQWNGKDVPDGVYYYIITTETKENHSGVIHVVR